MKIILEYIRRKFNSYYKCYVIPLLDISLKHVEEEVWENERERQYPSQVTSEQWFLEITMRGEMKGDVFHYHLNLLS